MAVLDVLLALELSLCPNVTAVSVLEELLSFVTLTAAYTNAFFFFFLLELKLSNTREEFKHD